MNSLWKWGRYVLPLFGLFLVFVQWAMPLVLPNNLLFEVPSVAKFPFLESKLTYFYLHLFTFIPVFLLSFDKNVGYYKNWKFLLPAILIVGTFFILWDVFFTVVGVWGFNGDYLSGIFWLGLPLEEWLFFFTVPFACVFIYECLNYYIKKDILQFIEPFITKVLIALFLGIGFLTWGRLYSTTTFLWTGFFLLFHVLFVKEGKKYRSRFYAAYLVSLLPFLIVNGVLTGAYTNAPIVIYNPDEYLGFRITSVPLDDAVYSFLLLMATITFYEKFRMPN